MTTARCPVTLRCLLPPSSAQLDTRIFTNGKTDKKIVAQLYASTFATLVASAETLDYAHLLWSQAQAAVLSLALPQFAKCSFLDVSRNPFGTAGVVKLTEGIAKMPALALRTLIMKCCRGLAVAAYVPKWSVNVAHVKTLELIDVTDNAFGRFESSDACQVLPLPVQDRQQSTRPERRPVSVQDS